jgi:hypothetical protein
VNRAPGPIFRFLIPGLISARVKCLLQSSSAMKCEENLCNKVLFRPCLIFSPATQLSLLSSSSSSDKSFSMKQLAAKARPAAVSVLLFWNECFSHCRAVNSSLSLQGIITIVLQTRVKLEKCGNESCSGWRSR